MQLHKWQRTGLTEGSLLYNEWLKQFGLYRADTEDEFINWLYSTSGFYDKDVKGSYFDIDSTAAKNSSNYQRFLKEYKESLKNSEWFHLMVHSSWHLNGLDKQPDFIKQFSVTNRPYWSEPEFLRESVKDQRVLVVSSIAPLIAKEYNVLPYFTPTTHLNSGPDQNFWETLDRCTEEIANLSKDFDFALISFGAYGCLLTDRLYKMGKSAATIGSGIYNLYPVKEIPPSYRPPGYEKIEDGRYWK